MHAQTSQKRRRGQLARALAVVLATAAGLVAPAGDAAAADPVQVGYNDTLLSVQLQFPIPTFIDHFQAGGGKLHRMSLSWQYYEPTKGTEHSDYFNRWNQLHSQELSEGIRQIIQLVGTPRWAVSTTATRPNGTPPCLDPNAVCLAPPNVRDKTIRSEWMSWVRTVVARYPTAAAIEVWNEPNMEWAWVIEQDPELYALITSATYDAVRSISPTMPVLAGGVAGYRGPDTATTTDMQSFVHTLFAVAGTQHFDAISLHAYPCGFGAPESRVINDINRMRAVKNYHGDRGKPIWITETGAASSGPVASNCGDSFTEAEQGPAIGRVIDAVRGEQARVGDVPAVIVNSLFNERPRPGNIDRPNSNGSHEYGLIAWRWTSMGSLQIKNKPGFATVACKFKLSC